MQCSLIENRSPYLNSELYKYVINLDEKNFVKNGLQNLSEKKSKEYWSRPYN